MKKILTFYYTYHILTLKFLYILFKISVVRTKNLPLFSTNWNISCMCFLNFIEFLQFLWYFLKFFPQFIQNSSSFPEYFLKIFTHKICLNIAWNCYKCTKNVLRISYKFFWNFRTFHKILSKHLEYLIFLCISFSKIFRAFPNNPAEIFKASFRLYSQNFCINTLIGWKFHKLYENLSNISNKFS